jgi:glutamate--cysteine ligase
MATASSQPVTSVDDLIAHFTAGQKPDSAYRIGVEHEKIAVFADGRAPDHATIVRLLEALHGQGGWERIEEHGVLIGLEGGRAGNVTLEPGGQLEHSGAPWPSATEAARDNDAHIDAILPIAAELGLTLLGVGFRPFGTLDDVPWMPKGRYRVMRAYLPTRGRHAHEMMKRTATVQANLDYHDEADAMEKLRLGLGLSSLVNALFAASPLVDGRPSGYQSYRGAVWLDTDPDRCGILPFAFEPGASFRDYTEWALDVPMFFVYRNGEYHALPERMPFRRFVAEGWQGERATMADWELHLSTLFPEVRLRRYVEVRQADASSRAMVRALPPLWRGILYDEGSRRAAWSLVADWSYDERLALYRETPRAGLRARVRGKLLRDLCRELVSIAKHGLQQLAPAGTIAPGVALLAPLEEIVESGRSVADRIVDAWTETGGDPAKLIPRLAL